MDAGGGLQMIDTTSVGIPSVNMSTGTGPVMGGVDYSQMAQDWMDPTILSAPEFGMARPSPSNVLSDANIQNMMAGGEYGGSGYVSPQTGVVTQPTGFATETGAGGFTGGSHLYDMGMDPTFANTGSWGVPQDTMSLPDILGYGLMGTGLGGLRNVYVGGKNLAKTVLGKRTKDQVKKGWPDSAHGYEFDKAGNYLGKAVRDKVDVHPSNTFPNFVQPGWTRDGLKTSVQSGAAWNAEMEAGKAALKAASPSYVNPLANIAAGYTTQSATDDFNLAQPVYTGGDPTIPGLNVSAALADPNITAQATQAMAAERSAAQLAQAAQSAGVDVSSIDPAVAAPGGYVNLDALAGQVTAAQEEQAAAAEQARQEEADAKAAEYMAAAADTQDMMMAGGLLGGGTAPLPAVSAPMAPRQDAMPEVSVPAPTAPTTAAVAAQARLDQQLADAAMRRAAEEAAAQDAARQAAQRAAVQADIAAAQAEQDMVRRANRIMRSKDYMDAGIGGLTGAQLDVLAAANIDTFAGVNRQVGGDQRDFQGGLETGTGAYGFDPNY